MKFEPSPNQALVLFGMLFGRTNEQREPMLAKLKPGLKPAERATLIDSGLTELRERAGVTYLVATSAAWDWANTHLGVALPNSLSAVPVLQDVLSRLAVFLAESGLTFSDFMALCSDATEENASPAVESCVPVTRLQLWPEDGCSAPAPERATN